MKNAFIIFAGLVIIEVTAAQSGNVGIGTTNPAAKLDVIGAIKITDGTQGAGKVLTSDASGKASWKVVSLPPSDTSGEYSSVWIGCNAWMTQNLDVSKYRNGDPIPKVTNSATWAALTTGAYCYYQNDSATYAAIYGKLYNWYAVHDPRGLAPEGWHIPSDFEWTYLVNTLGGNTVAGGPMKAMGTLHWTAPNLGATDLCNFAALPGGFRGVQGGFNSEGDFGHWWSSTPGGSDIAWSRKLNYLDTEISGAGSDMHIGYSVRCVRD